MYDKRVAQRFICASNLLHLWTLLCMCGRVSVRSHASPERACILELLLLSSSKYSIQQNYNLSGYWIYLFMAFCRKLRICKQGNLVNFTFTKKNYNLYQMIFALQKDLFHKTIIASIFLWFSYAFHILWFKTKPENWMLLMMNNFKMNL